MAIVATDWTIDRTTKVIAYVGNDHNGAAPSYATVIEFHRWLQGLADDAFAIASSSDELDITNTDPSRRSTDNIITLINGYTLNAAAPEHLYDGSIIQGTIGVDQIIWDGIVNFGTPSVQINIIQNGAVIADDFWNYRVGGTHTGAANAAVLTDSTKSWTTDEWVGYIIKNTTDGSWGVITANTATTITVAALYEGIDNDFDASDAYLIGAGLNPDAAAGISHRFMVKVHDFGGSGGDIDGRRLLGISRKFGYTYSEFSINGSSRGNNVLALGESADLNNATALSTVAGWSTITNTTPGYIPIDVNNDTTNEFFYSEWNKDIYSINQFFERMKYITREGTAETLYGLSGELFRGVTHEIPYTGLTGTFDEGNVISWTGTNSGTGQVLADNGTNTVWIQILTGVAPANTDSLSQSSPDAASATAGVVIDRSSTISTPFVGASTGSALIGAYGVGVEYADLTSADKLKALDNVVYTPPNNVQNTVNGVVSGEDYIIVAPWNGSTLDANGDPAILKTQLSLSGTLTTANVASIVVAEAIPADTPPTGTIRVTDNNGFERRILYTGWTGSTFTVDTAYHTANDTQNDFDTVNATTANDVYITYIDKLATGTSASFTSVQAGTRQLVVIVRDGGTVNATPIKQFISEWSQTTSPQTLNVIRTTDL